MTLKIGDRAPDFALRDSDKNEVTMSDYSGKNLLILFFPMAFTGMCTKELCSIRDDIGIYAGLEASILAISVDSPFSLAKFKDEQGYNFPLLSDFNKEVSRAYGALYEEFVLGLKGVSKRSAFVIDREGTIRYAEVLENAADLPNFEAIKETLVSFN